MEEGINSMVMKPTEDTKLECAPVEIIKMDPDRFVIKAGKKKMTLNLGEMKTCAKTLGKNILKYRYL